MRARSQALERPLALGLATLVLAVAIAPPVAAVIIPLLSTSPQLSLLFSASLWRLFAQTLLLSLLVTSLSLGMGVPLGLLFARARFPLRGACFMLHLSALFLPPFLPALGWFHLLGRGGLLGSEWTSKLLFSEVGMVLVLTACLAPGITALTALGVSAVDASLEEAARIVAGPLRTAVQIILPAAIPAVALGGLLVFALAFSELGVPMFLRVQAYPAVIFARLGGMDFAPGEAAIFVLPLMGLAVLLLWAEHRFAGRRAVSVLGHVAVRGALFGGGWALPAGILCGAAALLSLAPLVGLLGQARSVPISELVAWLGRAPWNSLRASLLAAAIVAPVALVVGHAVARGAALGRCLDALCMLAFLLPSSILGIGLISAWNRPATAWVYGSAGILVIAYVGRYAALAIRVVSSSVAQVPITLEHAAQCVGAGFTRRLFLIVARLGWRGVAGGFAIAVVFELRDLETAALFYPPGGEPLTVRILTLEANGPAPVVAALSIVHVALTSSVLCLAAGLLRSRSHD